jgi:hypothetical protein
MVTFRFSPLILPVLVLGIFFGPFDAEAKSPAGICKRVLLNVGVVVAISGAIPAANRGANWVRGEVSGQAHLGQGIFLDIENMEDALDSDQRLLLSDPQSNAVAIAAAYTRLMIHDYDDSRGRSYELFPAPVSASEFLDGGSREGGTCRHKACVLAGTLRHYGIRVHEYTVAGDAERQAHVFLYLPDHDAVFDPVVGLVGAAMADLERYEDFRGRSIINTSTHPLGLWYWVGESLTR